MAEEHKEMSFLQHLEELRRRLLLCAVGVVSGIVIMLFFGDFIINEIIMGPRKADFVAYKFWCAFSHKFGLNEQLCFSDVSLNLQNTTMSGPMNAYILVYIIGGVVLAFPFIFYQLWAFVKPGLRDKELRAVRGVVYAVSALFFAGVLFGYFGLVPLSVQFLSSLNFGGTMNNPTVMSYLKLVTSLVLGTGLVFQLPVLIYFLARIGLVSAAFLRKYRKHAFVVNLILSAIITPPDVISQMIVALPIFILYEVSIYLAARVERKKAMAGI